MYNKADAGLIVGLDVGTTKVVAIIGEISPDGGFEIIGVGTCPSRGLKRGMVVNIDATIQSIQKAIEEAELASGRDIRAVYTGISGSHIRSLNSHGIVAISENEISQIDIDRVIDAAKAVSIPSDQKILHILPQEFIIDSQDGVREPIGMSGVRLESKVHIVTGSVSAAQNIVRCVERCDLVVNDIILQQLASSVAVLSDDEKELGVCLIDIGGGTTDIAVFVGGAIRHSAVIPIGGDQVTNDVAVALRLPTKYAEEIKMKHASVLSDSVDNNAVFAVTGLGQRQTKEVSKKFLAEVVAARYDELFSLILAELRRNGFEDAIAAGIVLTGGASKMPGLTELAEQIFRVPARVGLPQNIGGLSAVLNNPIYATGIGLLLTGYQRYLDGNLEIVTSGEQVSLWERMRTWFQVNF